MLPRCCVGIVMVTQASRLARLRASDRCVMSRSPGMNRPCLSADAVQVSGSAAPTISILGANLMKKSPDGYVAGVDIGGTRIRMMLADLHGKPVAEWNIHMEEQKKTPSEVVDLVHHGLDLMLAQAGSLEPVIHLTAGAPGITDVRHGVVLAAPNLPGWNDVPLRMLLEQELSISTEIENDTNLAAVGEHAKGVANGIDNFVFVAIGTGVGAGIYLRGELYQGATWSAGEVGYLPVTGEPRQRILMRQTGQLERMIGGLGIEARWKMLLCQDGNTGSDDLLELQAPQIFDLVERGDTRAHHILQSTAQSLADALTMVALMYNPKLIVLGGGVGSHPALCLATTNYLNENEFAVPMLRSSSLGTRAQLFGAVSVSLAATKQKLSC